MIIVYTAIPATIVAIGAIALYIYIKSGTAGARASQVKDLSARSGDSESHINVGISTKNEIMHS